MIKTISIQGYKSFPADRPVIISLDQTKRVALFYGVNGAGKSAIGQVIQRGVNPTDPIAGCSISLTRQEPVEILVYNEDFIEANFRNRATMPGIFTIGKPQADALARAEELEKKSEQWRDRRDELAKQRKEREDEQTLALKTAHDSTWVAYTDQKNGPLKEWLAGYGSSKQKLFDALSAAAYSETSTPPTIEDLSTRTADVSDTSATTKSTLVASAAGFTDIENSALWAQSIVGSADSRLAPLIQQLGNVDWVKEGKGYLEHSDGKCPFCQQGLPHNFSDQVARLFDASYEKNLADVKTLAVDYKSKMSVLEGSLVAFLESEPLAQQGNLKQAWSDALLLLKENLSQMDAKVRSPSEAVSVGSSSAALSVLSDAVEEVNQRIATYNARISDRTNERERIRRGFWERLRHDHNGAIAAYEAAKGGIDRAISALDEELKQVKADLASAETEMTQLRSSTTGTDKAVDAINQRLHGLGIESFRIRKQEGEGSLYHLMREGTGSNDYRSLSEGEKTLITFLYFVELINGSAVADKTMPMNRKIVVIDDPISSLSHNYVYDIASIIVHDIIELKDEDGTMLKQVIVLTHSLFFHHELMKVGSPKGMELKRVVKTVHTDVVELGKDDLLNDYDAFWLVVRDAKEGRGARATVANAMRCILEHFFDFTRRKGDFKKALKEIGDEDHTFVPLARYLDRQSHSDGANRTDFGDYDLNYYLAKFERVFQVAEQMEHYRAMMHVDVQPDGATTPAAAA